MNDQAELESVLPAEAVSLKYVLICSAVCDCRLGGVGWGVVARAVLGEQVEEAGGDGVEVKGWTHRDSKKRGF